jgi:hemoglobin/transferrin/lactoferrin receptor protein
MERSMGLVAKRAALLMGGVAMAALGMNGAAAQSPLAGAGNTTLLERLVIGAGAPKVAIDTPQAVTVLDQQDIDAEQAVTIGELFDTVPGVVVVGSDRAFGEAFNIRGIGKTESSPEGARIVVNVDGQPKFFEQYRMGSFFSDPELYKRVEVLRGPASSTLYGAGAIGGVINFTTKDASDFIKEGYTGALRVKGGFTDNGTGTLTSAILAQQVNDTFEVLAAGNWRRSDDFTKADGTVLDGSAFDSFSGLLKGKAYFGDNDEQSLTASYQRLLSAADQTRLSQTGLMPGDPFGFVDLDVTDQTFVLAWENPDSDNPWVDLNVALSFSDTLNQQRNHRAVRNGPLTNAPSGTFADSDYQYRSWQLKADNTLEWVGDEFENFLTFGVQASTQDRIVIQPNNPSADPFSTHPQGTENKLGLFAQDEFVWDDRLTVIAGLRGDFHAVEPFNSAFPTRDGFALSPKLSALYEINDNFNVFASVAHTERLPTIDELYSFSDPSPRGSGKTPSFDLRKESANSVEFGAAVTGSDLLQSGDTASIKATAFHSHVTDMIASNTAGPPGSPPPTYYGNIDEAELYGVEIEGAYSSDFVFANLAYTLTIGNDLTTNTPLTTVPQSKLVATLGGRNPEWNLEYGARVTLAAEGEHIESFADGPAEAWQTLDVFASWKPDHGPFEGTELQASIENVFNADYRENLLLDRSKGRTFKLSIAKQFDY